MKKQSEFAFPHKQSHEQFQYNETVHHGLSIRDYFAAKAMQAMLSGLYTSEKLVDPDSLLEQFQLVPKNAYYMADQMLNAREQ